MELKVYSEVCRETTFPDCIQAYKDTLQCKSSHPHWYGYMTKPSTSFERFWIQIEEQAHATAETQQQNSELSQ
jgi:hypothetical protein